MAQHDFRQFFSAAPEDRPLARCDPFICIAEISAAKNGIEDKLYNKHVRLFCSCLLASSALLAQVRVDGTIVSDPGGAPVAGAAIKLLRGDKPAYAVTANDRGEFRLDAVEPGDYTADFSKPGFRAPDRNSPARRPFHVTASSADVHLEAHMVALARVSGTIFGADKHPAASADVQLFQAGSLIGWTSTTDAKGHFSFENVDPGIYILSSLAPKDMPPPAPQDGRKLGWSRTYFPGATYRADAQRFTIAPGAEIIGQDIQLQSVPVHVLRGRVLTPNGDPAPGIPVTAAPTSEIFTKDVEIHTHTAPDGSFEFPNLYDGDWRVEAELSAGSSVGLRALAPQSITGGDIDRLDLRLSPPFTVTGKVVYESSSGTTAQMSEGGILLLPLEGGNHVPTSPWKSDGSFQIESVGEGAYKIRPLPGNSPAYLASIRLGDREVMGQYVDVYPNAPPITITYRNDGGIVRGTVEECGKAAIVLVPYDPRLQSSEFFRQSSCRSGDRFEISRVRPGDYNVYAFDQAPGMLETSLFSDPSIVTQAVRVSVHAGESTDITLKVTHRN